MNIELTSGQISVLKYCIGLANNYNLNSHTDYDNMIDKGLVLWNDDGGYSITFKGLWYFTYIITVHMKISSNTRLPHVLFKAWWNDRNCLSYKQLCKLWFAMKNTEKCFKVDTTVYLCFNVQKEYGLLHPTDERYGKLKRNFKWMWVMFSLTEQIVGLQQNKNRGCVNKYGHWIIF